jgi:hypothetical protein
MLHASSNPEVDAPLSSSYGDRRTTHEVCSRSEGYSTLLTNIPGLPINVKSNDDIVKFQTVRVQRGENKGISTVCTPKPPTSSLE